MKKSLIVTIASMIVLTGCASWFSGSEAEQSFPKDPEKVRREKLGRITGDEGLKLFGESEDKNSGAGIAVNSFLWRATLETLSFVPISQADPFGGVILTDWYENPDARGERYKINALILDRKLRVESLKVSVHKQQFQGGNWRDIATDPKLARELEDKILAKARDMRIAQLGR